MIKNKENLKFFINQGYSKELSLYLIENYPPMAFGAGYLNDEDVEKAYQKWLKNTINEYNKKTFQKEISK